MRIVVGLTEVWPVLSIEAPQTSDAVEAKAPSLAPGDNDAIEVPDELVQAYLDAGRADHAAQAALCDWIIENCTGFAALAAARVRDGF